MNMEDETRVSVQAIRGKFEQLQESPLKLSPPSLSVTPPNTRVTKYDQECNFLPSQRLQKLSNSIASKKLNNLQALSTNPDDILNQEENLHTNKYVDLEKSPKHTFIGQSDNEHEYICNGSDAQIKPKLSGSHLQNENKYINNKKYSEVDGNHDFIRKAVVCNVTDSSDSSDLCDSEEDISFENRQKLIEGVVSNIKSKNGISLDQSDTRINEIKLRKFSITSKLEKDLKNKLQKNENELDYNSNFSSPIISPKEPNVDVIHKIPRPTLTVKNDFTFFKNNPVLKNCIETAADSIVKVTTAITESNIIHKPHKEEKLEEKETESPKLSRNNSEILNHISTNVENVKSSAINTKDEHSAKDIEPESLSPPIRPPRRKAGNGVLIYRKKCRAPPPPEIQDNVDSSNDTVSEKELDVLDAPKNKCQFKSNNDREKQYDACHKNKSNESVESTQASVLQKTKMMEETSKISPHKHEEDSSPSLSPKTRESKNSEGFSSKKAEEKKPPVPYGPPPKKPPRTFAYEIYKEFKEQQANQDEKENSKAAIPVYAQPNKKKNMTPTEDKLKQKPPISSKQKHDLTPKEISKPVIAPKPQHIMFKSHKRLSMVEPLLNHEKGEPTINMEFKRQAHTRFSLRRPTVSPPDPPNITNIKRKSNKENCNDDETYEEPKPFEQWHHQKDVEIHRKFVNKRSMSDETLYKGRTGKDEDDPIYAIPTIQLPPGKNSNELHYMCSVLYTENAKDGRGNLSKKTRRDISQSEQDINKNKPNIIALWKQELRQSFNHVHDRFKKNVGR